MIVPTSTIKLQDPVWSRTTEFGSEIRFEGSSGTPYANLPSRHEAIVYPPKIESVYLTYPDFQVCVSHVYPNFQRCLSHVYPSFTQLACLMRTAL
mmetsp:Transcript_49388/g.88242  ORF Transcript_49388/g.88242 Transcript_49388/m.88242 type:complete len:95 (+) Transcript_49388:2597-2881(+)